MMDSILTFMQSLQGFWAYALLLTLLVMSGFGLPINEDILLMVAAALTLKGVMEPVTLIAVAWVGLLTADLLAFHWGRRFGPQLLQHRILAGMVSAQRLATMQDAMRRYGPAYIFIARFMPGLRTPLLLAAGSLKTPYRYVLIYDGAAGLIEFPLLVYGVRYVGGRWQEVLDKVQHVHGILIFSVLLLVFATWAASRWRARRAGRNGRNEIPERNVPPKGCINARDGSACDRHRA